MNIQTAQINAADTDVSRNVLLNVAPEMNRLQQLGEENRIEVLAFLRLSPVHTVAMASFTQDNGFNNPDNSGLFYGYRNQQGTLEGIALIGHTTLIEARSKNSLTAFALVARESETPIHIMMSDGKTIETFLNRYADGICEPRLVCTEKAAAARCSKIAKVS